MQSTIRFEHREEKRLAGTLCRRSWKLQTVRCSADSGLRAGSSVENRLRQVLISPALRQLEDHVPCPIPLCDCQCPPRIHSSAHAFFVSTICLHARSCFRSMPVWLAASTRRVTCILATFASCNAVFAFGPAGMPTLSMRGRMPALPCTAARTPHRAAVARRMFAVPVRRMSSASSQVYARPRALWARLCERASAAQSAVLDFVLTIM